MSRPARDRQPVDTPSPAVREAAYWLGQQNPHPSPVIPALRRRFGLSALQACEAIRLQHSKEAAK